MSVMTKLYILLYCIATLVFVVVGGYIIWKKRRNIPHDCRSCAHCVLVEHGADGKLIYTCGIDRGEAPKVYYDFAVPVYCGWWNRWVEKPAPTSALYDKAEKMVGLLQEELDLFHAERVRAEEKAKILTVTELRKMEGEPVFLKSKGEDFKDGWSIITSVYREEICFQPTYKKLKFEDYGKTWLACRGEPEEEIERRRSRMVEYIERAAAIKSLELVAVGERAEDGAFNLAFAMAKERIYKLPVINVEPGKVREGGWITCESGMMCCSMCHTVYKDRMMPYYHFCPNCGAKMDGWRFSDGTADETDRR